MIKIIRNEELDEDAIRDLSPDEREWVYNGLDCCVTTEVLHGVKKVADNVTLSTYDFSKSLQGPILEINLRGTRINQSKRRNIIAHYNEQIDQLEQYLDDIISQGIGLPWYSRGQENKYYRSHKQLCHLFYTVFGIKPILKRNANGRFSPTVNREALEKLSVYFFARLPCEIILTLRDLNKKISFLETEVDKDDRIRTSFNIAGTNTGRLASSSDVFGSGSNLQNIERNPREHEKRYALRSCFISDPGMKLCNIDLEQADARNVGAKCWNLFAESHDEAYAGAYLDACESGDLHTRVCNMAWQGLDWGDDPSKWREVADQIAYRSDSYRDLSKKLGHGSNFYGTPPTMAIHTKVDTGIISEFQERYFGAFPVIGPYGGIKKDRRKELEDGSAVDNWHEWVLRSLYDGGEIMTLLGRRRYFFGRPEDTATLREAIAYEPQSMTADEIDIALLRLWRSDKPIQLLLQVHDSILFQYPEEQEAELIPWALEQMKVLIPLVKGREFIVPAEAKIGWNWGNYHEKDNQFGLMKWKGPDADKRPTPKLPKKKTFTEWLKES